MEFDKQKINITSENKQAIDSFNIQIQKLLIKIKGIIMATGEIKNEDYDMVLSLIKNFVIPGHPTIFVKFFKSIVFDNYYNFIKKRDDSLFSMESVMSEYKKIFQKLKTNGTNENINKIGNIILNVKSDKKNEIQTQMDKFNKMDDKECEKIFLEKNKVIKEGINKSRNAWDSLNNESKKEIWDTLNVMCILIQKYIFNK